MIHVPGLNQFLSLLFISIIPDNCSGITPPLKNARMASAQSCGYWPGMVSTYNLVSGRIRLLLGQIDCRFFDRVQFFSPKSMHVHVATPSTPRDYEVLVTTSGQGSPPVIDGRANVFPPSPETNTFIFPCVLLYCWSPTRHARENRRNSSNPSARRLWP